MQERVAGKVVWTIRSRYRQVSDVSRHRNSTMLIMVACDDAQLSVDHISLDFQGALHLV